MEKFIILPDVTCDLSQEIREEFGITDYIEGYVHINGESYKTRLDWQNISRDSFYKYLSDKKSSVSSAAASPEEYYLIFKKYVEAGYGVISMSLSSKISVTYNTASAAAERVRAEIPDAKIYCVDTLRMSGSFGLLVMYAANMQKNGATFDEVVAWLEENKHRVHQMGPIDDLTFIARRGRISKGKAFMGNLVGVKPMGDSNADGYVTVLAKVKGIKNALDVTAAYVERMATDVSEQYILIMHSDREGYANELRERIEARCVAKKVIISDVFSGCGTNIGPGMISAYFLGEPISPDCENEKQTLGAVISELTK